MTSRSALLHRTVGRVATLAVFLSQAFSPDVFAIPAYQATASATSRLIDLDEGDAGASASNSVFYPIDGKGATAQAAASAQSLQVFASAGIPGQPPAEPFPPLSVSGGGTARMRFEDVVVTNTADPEAPGNVPVSLTLELTGSFSLTQSAESDSSARGGVTITYGLGVPGPGSTAVPATIGNLKRELDRGDSLPANDGIFAILGTSDALVIDGAFQTPVFLVPVNTPLLLTIILNASANVVTRDGGEVSAISAFDNTLRFPLGGPVFDLPDGYTVNSVQAGIVNNVSAVPLPPALWLFGAGLAALAARRRRSAGNPARR